MVDNVNETKVFNLINTNTHSSVLIMFICIVRQILVFSRTMKIIYTMIYTTVMETRIMPFLVSWMIRKQ